jgi:site-specific recombinase XerD
MQIATTPKTDDDGNVIDEEPALETQKKVVTQSGQERHRLTCHSYRHHFAESFLQEHSNSSIYDLKELLGHHSVSVTEVYLNDTEDEYLRQQMQQFAPKS